MSFFSRSLPLLTSFAATLGAQPSNNEMLDLSLEELAQVQVTSIARKHGSVFNTAAAAYVLTGDDLRRSGATDLGSALRPVPGLQVGQIDPVTFAIGARGFNDSTSSKLLVLMDGRSLYSQTLSGAYWNYHELFFEDVDRLEVIRGPGASLWGANAVNGVINIVSKSAFSTQGSLLTVAHGDEFEALAGVRQGWQPTKSTAVRLYARYRDTGDLTASNAPNALSWRSELVGGRFDWRLPSGGSLALIAESRVQKVDATATVPTLLPPYELAQPDAHERRGVHALARWRQSLWGAVEFTAQVSYERMRAHDLIIFERHGILDADLQLGFRQGKRHDVLAGLSMRRDKDQLHDTPYVMHSQPEETTTFMGAFLQDDISLVAKRLNLTIGTKVERNTFTGWEVQPSVRLLFTPSRTQTYWAAVSRAARTPSRAERAVKWLTTVYPPSTEVPLPVLLIASGSERFDSEYATALEAGHRLALGGKLTVDAALFLNEYREMRGLEQTDVLKLTPVPHIETTLMGVNRVHGQTYGGELLVRWKARDSLTLEGSASTLRYDLREKASGAVPPITIPALVGSSPRHEYKLRGTWDFADDWSLDLVAWRTDAMPFHNIPGYLGLNTHLSWSPRHDLEVELVGRNVLEAEHAEAPSFFLGGQVRQLPRSFFLRVTYRR